MTKLSTRIISDSGVLVISLMLSNMLNFVYNAYLGRSLEFEEFGLITLVNTFLFVATMFLGGFGATIEHRVAFLLSSRGGQTALQFFLQVRKYGILVVFALTTVWLVGASWISQLFRIEDSAVLLHFSPIFILLVFLISGRSFLQGTLAFGTVALVYLVESISKLVSAFILVEAGYSSFAYLSVPFSVLCAALFCSVALLGRKKDQVKKEISSTDLQFPFSFYFASIFNGLTTTAFLSVDVLLAKHFLSPTEAGQYALLSLVGKMVYFIGSLCNSFMITFVSRDLGKGKSPSATFYTLFGLAAFFSLNAFALFGPLGYLTVPVLFGEKTRIILSFLPLYSFGIALFTLSNTIVQYRVVRHQYLFPVLSILSAAGMFIGINSFHADVAQIAQVVSLTGILGFMVISVVHVLADQGKFIFRNLIDLFDLFAAVGNEDGENTATKRILIFNWRDIKHVKAGGAEVYIHELAKRWVTDGCKVTLFCGNDGHCARYEEVDGVEIVRRGGFYFVYVWAFLYYLLKFRGKYDVIIDCENGIPFFTPLYTKEKQYLVIHHVHHDVFQKMLPAPLAQFAVFMETKFMPYVYEQVEIITVSPSSKEEIAASGLSKQPIHVVYNGVNVDLFAPAEKSVHPLVLYLGRLKGYKSVDVFVKSAQKVLQTVSNAEFVIAGDGEERKHLEKLAAQLGIADKIRFLGKVTEEMKVKLYQQAWVFVNPSFREGWGITTIEANACATPVVASRVSGLIDSVKNPHTGFLVDYGDVDGFAMRISELLADNNLRSAMSSESLKWSKEFSWDTSARKALEVLFYE